MTTPLGAVDFADEAEQRAALAGPGTTRQNRRLQLRKNGFRGRALPNRNITPRRNSSPGVDAASASASAAASASASSDPIGSQPESSDQQGVPTRGRSSSILQEINNSSLRRKANKAKHDSVLSVFQDENGEQKKAPWNFESSPACLPLEAPNLTKSRKKHQRTTSVRSNPDSDFADQHIAYLESELASYQSQIASLTSPSVAKEKSQKLRLMNQEIKRLQDENTRWENEFEERVGGLTEEHTEVEATLRARINLLELDMENHVQKVKELQAQLEATRKALEIAENANVEFEKRLETFAHLLVTSPKKQETPLAQPPFSNGRRHSRQRLSLHRFPTTGSIQQTLDVRPEAVEQAVDDQLDTASDAEYDAEVRVSLATRASRYSLNLQDILNRDIPSSSTKPSRRMRRFHGGSHNPKPLILSAAQLSPILASAPVLEPTLREFPFPDHPIFQRRNTYSDVSPLTGRRRALTSADGLDASELQPLPALPTTKMLTPPSEPSKSPPPVSEEDTDSTPKDYSSIGPNLGRSLFEELRSARQEDSSSPSTKPTPFSTLNSRPDVDVQPEEQQQPNISSLGNRRVSHQRSISEHTALPLYSRVPSLHALRPPPPRQQQRSLLTLLKELWRAPYTLAQRCLHRAHSTMLISRAMHKLQWWLVHALLGPMATRHLMACSLQDTLLLSPTESIRLRRRNHRREHSSSSSFPSSDSEEESDSPCPQPRNRNASNNRSTDPQPRFPASKHSPWLWIKFSLTLAFAIGAAMKDGPGVLLRPGEREGCACRACDKKRD